jgi:hypothetical protein
VTVKSWNSRSKSVVAHSQGSGAETVLVRPNLTAAQAQNLAAMQLAALGRHALVMSALMPGELRCQPGMTLALNGTGAGLDQNYTVMAVTRRLVARHGFVQEITAYAAVEDA